MGRNALIVNDLTKMYKDFVLDKVSFQVPCGAIVGLVGENGAGKSTTLNTILGIAKKDDGSVQFFDGQSIENEPGIRAQIGVVLENSSFPDDLSPRKLNSIFKRIYGTWDEGKFYSYLKKLDLPESKKIKTLSKGMKMKLSIAAAFSHNSKLLILDEVTSGLDPVIRDDILDMLLDFVQDENNSILVSSHISSDLEKVADYIVFIHNGKVIFSKPKDELIYHYGIIRCGAAQFDAIDKKDVLAYRKLEYEWEALVSDKASAQKKYPKAVIDAATIDDIMLLYIKGDAQ